jgi:hypothetical protein
MTNETGSKMPIRPARYIGVTLLALTLAACASRNQTPVAALNDDDDAVCRANNIAPGSPEYVACRKDRDVQRNAAIARADRRQRDLGEYMLNHP